MRTREKTMNDNMNLHILDRLDAKAKRDIVHQETFQLQKPSYLPDDLDEATTNGSSIEIEIVEE
tara:strand:+ start:1045 stop:1236 length:192 start_codon:yes stop_codon:yes gene_type:complete